MRSATAGACGSSRRLPRPRLPPACSFLCRIIVHSVSNRRGLRLKPPHPPAKIASRMQFFCVGEKKGRASGAADVVLQGLQILIPSSGGTTSLCPFGLSTPRTWCFKARKSLFLRREAPRPWVRPDLRRRGRGASRPANPYSFVGRHHVPESVRTFDTPDVVLHGPQILILSSGGTTSLGASGILTKEQTCTGQ